MEWSAPLTRKHINGDYLRDMADLMRNPQLEGRIDWILWQIMEPYMVLDVHLWQHSTAGARRAWAVFRETVYPRDHLKGDVIVYELRDNHDSATLHQAIVPATELEPYAARLAGVQIPLSRVGDAAGANGTWYGLEMRRFYATARLQWWSALPQEWDQLRRAVEEFRRFLEQIIEDRGEIVASATEAHKA